jgi:hypothetical protein
MSFETSTTYLGKPLNLCSREELIKCLELTVSYRNQLFDPKNVRALALGKIEMMKRGEY